MSFDEKMNALKELHCKYVAVHDLEVNIKDSNDTINENTRQRKHFQEVGQLTKVGNKKTKRRLCLKK